jgi:hypothetical protein
LREIASAGRLGAQVLDRTPPLGTTAPAAIAMAFSRLCTAFSGRRENMLRAACIWISEA